MARSRTSPAWLRDLIRKLMRGFVERTDWLTVVRLPTYAAELDPTEGEWSHVKRDLPSLAAGGHDQLAATSRH